MEQCRFRIQGNICRVKRIKYHFHARSRDHPSRNFRTLRSVLSTSVREMQSKLLDKSQGSARSRAPSEGGAGYILETFCLSFFFRLPSSECESEPYLPSNSDARFEFWKCRVTVDAVDLIRQLGLRRTFRTRLLTRDSKDHADTGFIPRTNLITLTLVVSGKFDVIGLIFLTSP